MSNYLYTMTNQGRGNAVVAMTISADGTLKFVNGSPFKTGGKGLRSTESQNAVWIEKDLLCAVDPGSNSFAIFRRGADGSLTRLNDKPVSSEGVEPCSACISSGIVYVLNAGSSDSANVQPSIAAFALEDGGVRHLPKSDVRLGAGETPRQVIVNRQGTLLAVSSMGARGSLLHCYKVNPAATSTAGLLSKLRDSPFLIKGADFGFGSAWNSDGTTLFMTNANGDASVVRLKIDRETGRIIEEARVQADNTACWCALGKDNTRLYVTNAASVLVFDVSGGRLNQIQSVDVNDIPNPIVHDLILDSSEKFVFVIEQRNRRILVFRIGTGGRVTLNSQLAIGARTFPLGLAVA
jgi:6-phosphogluconolactonase (cycloisomerase 2 family)